MILIVDDNHVDAIYLQAIAHRHHIGAHVAKNFTEAFEAYDRFREKITLIVSDLELGAGERGDVLLEKLEDLGFEGVTVLVSAYESLGRIDRSKVNIESADYFFCKPVRLVDLEGVIKNMKAVGGKNV